jgi:hypothetical protein
VKGLGALWSDNWGESSDKEVRRISIGFGAENYAALGSCCREGGLFTYCD